MRNFVVFLSLLLKLLVVQIHGQFDNTVDDDNRNYDSEQTLQCEANEFHCFACLDRGMTDCVSGENCCPTACYTMKDMEKDILVKGCWTSAVSDRDLQTPSLRILTDLALPWNGKLIGGMTTFCKEELCNVEAKGESSLEAELFDLNPQNLDGNPELPNQALRVQTGLSAFSVLFLFLILLLKYSILTFGDKMTEKMIVNLARVRPDVQRLQSSDSASRR